MRSIEIGRIQKSKTVSLVFEIIEIEGRFFVNIREYVKGKKFTGFTKKGYVFNIKYLDNVITLLNEAASFVSSKDWEEKFDETYDAQANKSKKGHEIVDRIYKYLNGQEDKSPTESEIIAWVKYCYDSKQFRLAIELFDSINKEGFSNDGYKNVKKIIDICRIKSE